MHLMVRHGMVRACTRRWFFRFFFSSPCHFKASHTYSMVRISCFFLFYLLSIHKYYLSLQIFYTYTERYLVFCSKIKYYLIQFFKKLTFIRKYYDINWLQESLSSIKKLGRLQELRGEIGRSTRRADGPSFRCDRFKDGPGKGRI